MTQASKPTRDWEAIERDYRAGVLSLREIAAEHDLTEAAIRKRAKRDGWSRDLSAKIQARAPVIPDDFGRAGFLYVVFLTDSAGKRFYKIGMAAAFTPRFQAHQCASPFKIHVACAYYTADMRAEERALHQQFGAQRIRGEWFALSDDDVAAIAQRGVLI